MFLKPRIVLGVGNHVQFCICSFWLINCRVNFCLLTLAVLDISYGCKGTMLSKLSPCNFFTTTVLIGALVVKHLFIHVQTSVQTDWWIIWGSLTIGPCLTPWEGTGSLALLQVTGGKVRRWILVTVWPVLDSPDECLCELGFCDIWGSRKGYRIEIFTSSVFETLDMSF